jgi:hypothetical protein
MFDKILTNIDLDKFYLPKAEVSKLCLAAFDHENVPIGTEIELPVYNPWMTRSGNMILRKTTGGKWYFKNDWSVFARAEEFHEGQEIYFIEYYKCNRGTTDERFIMIGRVPLFRGVIG